MSTTLNIRDILSKVKKLGKDDQLTLLESLAAIIRKNETLSRPPKLSKNIRDRLKSLEGNKH